MDSFIRRIHIQQSLFLLAVLILAPLMDTYLSNILLYGGNSVFVGVMLLVLLLVEPIAVFRESRSIAWQNSFFNIYAFIAHIVVTLIVFVAAVNALGVNTQQLPIWVGVIAVLLVFKEVVWLIFVSGKTVQGVVHRKHIHVISEIIFFLFSITTYALMWSVLVNTITIGENGFGVLLLELFGLGIIFFIAYMGSNANYLLFDSHIPKKGKQRAYLLASSFFIALIPPLSQLF